MHSISVEQSCWHYLMVWDWWVLRTVPMLFYWLNIICWNLMTCPYEYPYWLLLLLLLLYLLKNGSNARPGESHWHPISLHNINSQKSFLSATVFHFSLCISMGWYCGAGVCRLMGYQLVMQKKIVFFFAPCFFLLKKLYFFIFKLTFIKKNIL